MNFLECDLEDLIFEYSLTEEGREILANRGLYLRNKLLRQVGLDVYGTADLIEISGGSSIHVTVIELKKGELNYKEYGQLCRYLTAVKRLIDVDVPVVVQGILIGKEIKLNNDFCYLVNESNVWFYTYEFSLEKGLVFERSDRWRATSEGEKGSKNELLEGVFSEYYPQEEIDFHKQFNDK